MHAVCRDSVIWIRCLLDLYCVNLNLCIDMIDILYLRIIYSILLDVLVFFSSQRFITCLKIKGIFHKVLYINCR